jgi:elongation factor P--(R)-beta-lysine ligase
MNWQPGATLTILRQRAAALASVREFFATRALLEVDTPALVRHAVTDVHIHSAEVQLRGHHSPLYLHTSPEYAMKRLLAAGSGDIYQIARVFRAEEHSHLHNAEFTLIEWYRCGFSMTQLIREVAELTHRLLALPADAPYDTVSYSLAFEQKLGVDPLQADDATLREVAAGHGLDAPLTRRCTRDELLDWLMGAIVGPGLGSERLCFVHRYPASQAALARLDPEDARVALRFELYSRGIELANGFEELADASEQRHRFEQDLAERRRRHLPALSIDESLLAALEHGMPAVSGVALGFDRALMLRCGVPTISEVLPFELARA